MSPVCPKGHHATFLYLFPLGSRPTRALGPNWGPVWLSSPRRKMLAILKTLHIRPAGPPLAVATCLATSVCSMQNRAAHQATRASRSRRWAAASRHAGLHLASTSDWAKKVRRGLLALREPHFHSGWCSHRRIRRARLEQSAAHPDYLDRYEGEDEPDPRPRDEYHAFPFLLKAWADRLPIWACDEDWRCWSIQSRPTTTARRIFLRHPDRSNNTKAWNSTIHEINLCRVHRSSSRSYAGNVVSRVSSTGPPTVK